VKRIILADLVYVPPILHLCACAAFVVTGFESAVQYLIVADFPLSMFVVALGWPRGTFMFWFATLGTLWWLAISYGAYRIFCGNRSKA
jgi:hypothetical protein